MAQTAGAAQSAGAGSNISPAHSAGPAPTPSPAQTAIPGATYRLQFNAQFRFEDASATISYLKELGVTHLYASPLFTSGSQSTHGYDVCSYREFDPKLGGSDGFTDLVGHLRAAELNLLLDIVPNHMRADISNAWWRDVLEKGPNSPYALYFDINWDSFFANVFRKVLIPVLGAPYSDILEKGEIQLVFSEGSFWVAYGSNRFPASWATYIEVFKVIYSLLSANGPDNPELITIQKLLDRCADAAESQDAESLKTEWRALLESTDTFRASLERALTLLNGTPGNPRSFDRLDRVLQQQHYRLCWWRTGPEQIDYRRFFDITDLVCVNVQRPEVFDSSHDLLRSLIERGIVSGLRIDHPDGLWDPQQYFSRLLNLWPGNTDMTARYIVAEKILSGHEQLPLTWPLAGTTGYEFLNQLNSLFVDSSNKEAFTEVYKGFAGKIKSFRRLLVASRLKVLKQSFSGQFESLVESFQGVAAQTRYGRDFTAKSIRAALSHFISTFPVYRTYVTERTQSLSFQERRAVERACRESGRKAPSVDSPALAFLRRILLLEFPQDFDEEAQAQARRFIMKLQQLTAPLAAKGMEDTAFYIYARLISLNEVGGNPENFGASVEEFHKANEYRERHWPNSLLATATHDTKRGEDARARINVLSEQPEEWAAALARWRGFNEEAKTAIEGNPAPFPNDEYFLYQALLGSWEPSHREEYSNRVKQYLMKSIREAKEYTSWTDQNAPYEYSMQAFIGKILSPHSENRFLPDFEKFTQWVSFFGYLNSLSQVLLKTVSPGVPDFYQGTELWDFSFVDPDNRHPIDYSRRIKLLENLASRHSQIPRADFLRELLAEMPGGAVKLFVIWQLLQLRRERRNLFDESHYLPATVSGSASKHVCAFARVRGAECIIAIAPRFISKLMRGEERFPLGADVWTDTRLTFSLGLAAQRFHDLFSGREFSLESQDTEPAGFWMRDLLAQFPIALLHSTP